MTRWGFLVLDIRAERHAASPTLMTKLRITEGSGETVHALALRAQVRIAPQRRNYDAAEKEALLDLFGDPDRWGTTLNSLLWMHCTAMVPGFTGETEVELPLPCTYDTEVAASKYMHGLSGGDIALSFLFNGTVFTKGATGFSVSKVPWDAEAGYRMPVTVWREVMDHYFPNSGWLRLDRDTLAALSRYKSRRSLPTWEQAFDMLLKEAGEEGA
jgi:hypothetical protein